MPDFFGGFGTSVSFKDVNIGANFQYGSGGEIFWRVGHYIACNGCGAYNQIAGQQYFWTPQNKDATVPEPRISANGSVYSTRYLSDGSFLRLKSLNLSYTFDFTDSSVELYIQGRNLFTITSFRGLDPQGAIGGSNKYQGVKFYNQPLPKRWMFGVKFTF